MKIAFVCQDLVGQGVQYATAIIARAFARKGWVVDILVSQVHVDLIKAGKKSFELPPNVKIVAMPSRRGSQNGWFVRRYLKTGGADIVLAESGIYSWCICWASFGIPKRKLPKLAQVIHGNEDVPRGITLWKRRLQFWFHYRKFSTLMFVNEKSAENFKTVGSWSKHLHVACVNNACVDDVFHEKVKLPPTHPWLLNKESPTLVTAGAYQPYKDHMTLLRAMTRVKESGRHVRVIVFGRGPLEDEYKKYIAENQLEEFVSVGGFTDRLPAEIKASDGFVLSSNWESFGIVLGEALACRVPCIATDAPYGPREILADGKYGRLIPVGDDKAMAMAIGDLVEGKIPVAPDEAWQRYTIEKIEERYFDALEVE